MARRITFFRREKSFCKGLKRGCPLLLAYNLIYAGLENKSADITLEEAVLLAIFRLHHLSVYKGGREMEVLCYWGEILYHEACGAMTLEDRG